ncbi:hypothetical protein GCM10020331_016540 [Ectobacillus funiculus]
MKGSMFYRDTWVEVNLDAIYTNVANAKHHVGEGTEVIAAVKANAYGHGYVPVAKTALEAGASRLAVAFFWMRRFYYERKALQPQFLY